MGVFNHVVLLNNKDTHDYSSFTITHSLNTPVHTADITFYDKSLSTAEEIGQTVKIYYYKHLLFSGLVVGMDRGISDGQLTFTLKAKGLFVDLAESSIDINAPLFKKQSFTGLLRTACRLYKATNKFKIQIKDTVPITKEEREKVLPEEMAWNLIQDYAKKRKCLLFAKADNTLVASDNVWLLGAKHVLDKAEDAQVKGFSWASDTSSLFYKYSYVSELAATDLKGNKLKGKNGKTTTISGSNVDVRVRKQRMSCVNIKVEKDKLLAAKKNKYRMSHAVATEKSMSVDIYDFAHYHSKKIFYIGDYLDYVNDTLGVDGIFLISDITYSFSLTEGHTAKLTLADPKAYIPEPPDEITKAQRRRKKQQTKKVKEKDKKKGAITYGKTTLENLMGSK